MSSPALTDCLRIVTQESGGALSVHVVFLEDIRDLITDALIGDPDAAQLLPLVRQGIRSIRSASRKKPALCGCCPRPIRSQFALAIVLPERDDPTQGIAIGLCPKCTENDVCRAHQKAAEALRAIWPDGRLVQVTHRDGGRA